MITTGSQVSGTEKILNTQTAVAEAGKTYRFEYSIERQPLATLFLKSDADLEKEALNDIISNIGTNYPGATIRYIKVDLPNKKTIIEITMPKSASGYVFPAIPVVVWYVAIVALAVIAVYFIASAIIKVAEVLESAGPEAIGDVATALKYGAIGVLILVVVGAGYFALKTGGSLIGGLSQQPSENRWYGAVQND